MARKRYQPEVIAASGGYTTSRNLNIAGLSSAIALANDLRTKYSAHVADYGSGTEEHKALHTAGQLAAASVAATDLTSLLVLVNDLTAKYTLHNTDMIAATPTYHREQDTTHALAATTTVTTLSGAITRLNDFKAKFNLHDAEVGGHTTGSKYQSATADAALGAAILVPCTGAKSGDVCLWSVLKGGTGSVTGVSAVPGAGNVSFTFSADPQDDAIISYAVFSKVV